MNLTLEKLEKAIYFQKKGDFKNAEIYFISGRNDLTIEKSNIKQIRSFNEFVQLLD